jgi:hypothetical protein
MKRTRITLTSTSYLLNNKKGVAPVLQSSPPTSFFLVSVYIPKTNIDTRQQITSFPLTQNPVKSILSRKMKD